MGNGGRGWGWGRSGDEGGRWGGTEEAAGDDPRRATSPRRKFVTVPPPPCVWLHDSPSQPETTPEGPHHPDESLLHLRRLLVSGYMVPPLPP